MKRCPNCSEKLEWEAILCTHCGYRFAPIPAVAASGFRPTPFILKIGCGVLILAAFAIGLWAFSSLYQEQSPPAANAIQGRGGG